MKASSALRTANALNIVQRRWCESILARAPEGLSVARETAARALAWLSAHEHRVLSPAFRARLAQFDRMLPHAEPRPAARAKQLSLSFTRRS